MQTVGDQSKQPISSHLLEHQDPNPNALEGVDENVNKVADIRFKNVRSIFHGLISYEIETNILESTRKDSIWVSILRKLGWVKDLERKYEGNHLIEEGVFLKDENGRKYLSEGKKYVKGMIAEGTFSKEGYFTKGTVFGEDGSIFRGIFSEENAIEPARYCGMKRLKDGTIQFVSLGLSPDGLPIEEEIFSGTKTFQNGEKQEFESGKITKITTREGDVLEGRFDSKKRLREGTKTSSDGKIWEGCFGPVCKDSKGQDMWIFVGQEISKDGTIQMGTFEGSAEGIISPKAVIVWNSNSHEVAYELNSQELKKIIKNKYSELVSIKIDYSSLISRPPVKIGGEKDTIASFYRLMDDSELKAIEKEAFYYVIGECLYGEESDDEKSKRWRTLLDEVMPSAIGYKYISNKDPSKKEDTDYEEVRDHYCKMDINKVNSDQLQLYLDFLKEHLDYIPRNINEEVTALKNYLERKYKEFESVSAFNAHNPTTT